MARYIQSVGLVLVLLTLCLAECSFKWAALEGDICASLSAEWNIAIEQFELWNPGVDCTEPLKAQQEYCIEWTGPESTAPTTSTIVTLTATAKATSTTSKTTSIPAEPSSTHPSPVQPDIEKTCELIYFILHLQSCVS